MRARWERGSVGYMLPSLRNEIAAAARRISPYVRRTPVVAVDIAGAPVLLKLELLQHAGSFKPRGAFNRLLSGPVPEAGVIAASGGNHGAAVAYVARALSVPAEIFVPESTPETKTARIARYGARVVRTGTAYAEALAASRERQHTTGALEVHAYDDPFVVAGQGTLGRELEGQAPDLTHVLVATGGGGLIGGVLGWYAGSAAVISVEPETCPTLHAALAAGKPLPVPVSGLASDSLGARQVGDLMFPLAQAWCGGALLVPDEAIRAAQRWLWEQVRLVAEPGGAVALAAVLSGAFQAPGGARVGVVVCGANTDPGSVV